MRRVEEESSKIIRFLLLNGRACTSSWTTLRSSATQQSVFSRRKLFKFRDIMKFLFSLIPFERYHSCELFPVG